MSRLPPFSLTGDKPVFSEPKPTGNLYQPSIDRFLGYSRVFYQNKRYTDDGQLCRMLESRLAQFHAVDRAVCVVSCFWGLVLAISSLALPGRVEIITPAFGYRRTGDIIAWAGYVPHFCDVDPGTLGISVDTIRPAVNGRTALILAPHPMVNCCDARGIEDFGRERGIPVVFDSVEAAYRVYDDRRIGGFGDAEVFSTHSTKLLNSFEGGYITTNNLQLADRLDQVKRHGLVYAGAAQSGRALNAKLNEVHAALALASLDELDQQIDAHRRKYELYAAGLRNINGLSLLEHQESKRPDYRIIVVRIAESWPLSREATLRVLEAENVLARPYYTPLTHDRVAYARVCPQLPITEAIYQNFMVLPSGAHVSEEDVGKIVDMLADLRQYGRELSAAGA